jgi:hypothetical protein
MPQAKQIQAKPLRRVQVHSPAEKPGSVVLELVTKQGSEYFALDRDSLVKLAAVLTKAAGKAPSGLQ